MHGRNDRHSQPRWATMGHESPTSGNIQDHSDFTLESYWAF